MKIKVGINGMGRIGRMILRSIFVLNYKDWCFFQISGALLGLSVGSLISYLASACDVRIAVLSIWEGEVKNAVNMSGQFRGAMLMVR